LQIVLFLGAGASQPFHKPTTTKLKEILLESYNEVSQHDQLLRVLLEIEEFKDIEYVLRAIDEISEFSKKLGNSLFKEIDEKKLGHQMLKFSGPPQTYTDVLKTLNEIQATVEDEVFEKYSWSHEDDSDKILPELFNPVFKFLNDNSESIKIVTTNYDRAIEEYCESKNITYVDGFKPNPSNGRAIWADGDFSYYDNDTTRSKMYLAKLHGSLGWKQHKKGYFERTTYERKSTYPNYIKDLLIYPLLDPKHAKNEEPFASIRQFFYRTMEECDVCIAIGYSFRDSHVNEIFNSHIEKGKTFISIAPHCILDYHENLLKEKLSEKNKKAIDKPGRTEYTAKSKQDGPDDRDLHLLQKRLNEKTVLDIIHDIKRIIEPDKHPF